MSTSVPPYHVIGAAVLGIIALALLSASPAATFYVCGLVLYFLPTLVAVRAHKKNQIAIFALNLLAGWTFVGWVVAMVWALIKD